MPAPIPASVPVWDGHEASGVRGMSVAAGVLLIASVVTAVIDLVGAATADAELEIFLKSAKNPCWIPNVRSVSLQDSVCVPQYHSPPPSPGTGTSPEVESQMCRLLSKLALDRIDTFIVQVACQRIRCLGSRAIAMLDQCNSPAS